MSKISKEDIQKVANMQPEMSKMTQDEVKKVAPKADQKDLEMTIKERAKFENAHYIEPRKQLKPIVPADPKQDAKRKRDWEYVKGVFQNETMNGLNNNEPIRFWFLKWPGDPYCEWEIPCGVPVYVPRMIALLLSGERDPDTGIEAMKYHKFEYVDQPTGRWQPDQFTHHFRPTATHYRGKFTAVGSFS